MKSKTINNFFSLGILITFLVCVPHKVISQVTIGSLEEPDSSAALDIVSIDKGLLIPRVSLKGNTDTTTILNPANSLIVYNLTDANNSTLSDDTDDVYADRLYSFLDGRWYLLYEEEDMEEAIDSLKLPKIISIVSMKASGNDLTYVSDVLGTSGIRKLLFDNKYRDDLDCFDTTTGNFTAPYTGLYRIEINILLRPNNISASRSMFLGISKLTTATISGDFYSHVNILDPATNRALPSNLTYKTTLLIQKGQKIAPLVKYINPTDFTLNVEAINYTRTYVNTMSIVYYPI